MAKRNTSKNPSAEKLEHIKEIGADILARRKDYFIYEDEKLEDVGSLILDRQGTILEYSGEAFITLDFEQSVIGQHLERRLFHVDKKDYFASIDSAFQDNGKSFVFGAGLRIGETEFFTHYDISGRIIRENDPTKFIRNHIIGFSILLRRAIGDVNPEANAKIYPHMSKLSIEDIKEIERIASPEKKYVINLRNNPQLNEKIVGAAGEAYLNNRNVSLLGVSTLSPLYYTGLRDKAYESKRPKDSLGLKELSLANPRERKT